MRKVHYVMLRKQIAAVPCSELFFQIKLFYFLDTLTQQIIFLILNINNFWGDLSGISSKTATLVPCRAAKGLEPGCLSCPDAAVWKLQRILKRARDRVVGLGEDIVGTPPLARFPLQQAAFDFHGAHCNQCFLRQN